MMIGVLAYGSLIEPDEHLSQKGLVDAIPVKVSGFKRLFDQRPSWRKGEGDRLAVLNVAVSSAHSINAICLCFESEERESLRKRERGYLEAIVSRNKIRCYEGFDLPELTALYLYIGKEEKRADDILPNDAYLDLCIHGALKWGKQFCHEFVSTTYIADGTALHAYLTSQSEALIHPCAEHS